MRSFVLFAAILAAGTGAALPAYADGQPCSLVSAWDPTGVDQQTIGARTMQAGPWQVAVLPPTLLHYVKPSGAVAYLCTDITWTGGSHHAGCAETVEIAHGCSDTGPGPGWRCHPVRLP